MQPQPAGVGLPPHRQQGLAAADALAATAVCSDQDAAARRGQRQAFGVQLEADEAGLADDDLSVLQAAHPGCDAFA
jgi:hypothetical protein